MNSQKINGTHQDSIIEEKKREGDTPRRARSRLGYGDGDGGDSGR
jgi:hypothetical protein